MSRRSTIFHLRRARVAAGGSGPVPPAARTPLSAGEPTSPDQGRNPARVSEATEAQKGASGQGTPAEPVSPAGDCPPALAIAHQL